MANWNQPTVGSDYIQTLAELKDRDIDAATMFSVGVPSNIPTNAVRWNTVSSIFQQWDGDSWNDLVIGVASGGTGSSTPSGARTALGLGTMATQNNNAVNITGGSITGINFDAGSITSGIVPLVRGGTSASLALGAAGTVMLSNGTGVVFASGTSIAALNASNLTTGIVPIARLSGVGILANSQEWTGVNTFPRVDITNPEADIYFTSTLGGVNQKRMRMAFYLGNMYFIRQNDAGGDIATPFSIRSDDVLFGNGGGLDGLNAGNLASGIVPLARLGAGGVPSASTFLRGDNTWAVPPAGGVLFPGGFHGLFDTACPAGWTRIAAADNRYLMLGGTPGAIGGRGVHGHNFSVTSGVSGDHNHHMDFTRRSGNILDYGTGNYQPGSSPVFGDHKHDVRIDGDTQNAGSHSHPVSGSTGTEALDPYWYMMVLCRKD